MVEAMGKKEDLVAVSVAAKVVAICVGEGRFMEEMMKAKGKKGEERTGGLERA
ncbi:hypothetical protein HDU93_004235, partial [Gonapodya sp. JEL0774]